MTQNGIVDNIKAVLSEGQKEHLKHDELAERLAEIISENGHTPMPELSTISSVR